jgi:hypothetical protein
MALANLKLGSDTMKKIAILLLFVIISACSSPYVLSDAAKRQLSSLNKQTAEKNIEKLSQRSKQAGGLCLAGSLHTGPGTVPIIKKGKLQFTASYEVTRGYTTTPSAGGISVQRHYTVHEGKFAISINDLKSIRIVSGNTIPACHYDGSGKIVIIADNKGIDGMINVTDTDLDLLIASLHYLSPKAVLKQGAGF